MSAELVDDEACFTPCIVEIDGVGPCIDPGVFHAVTTDGRSIDVDSLEMDWAARLACEWGERTVGR